MYKIQKTIHNVNYLMAFKQQLVRRTPTTPDYTLVSIPWPVSTPPWVMATVPSFRYTETKA